ncbi:MAG: DUF4276 family protein [Thiotrichaceae bacterium]
MKPIVFLLEEPSAREMLQGLLPRILSEEYMVQVKYIVFQGKQDLEKNIARKLKHWNEPMPYFIILRDQDSGNCVYIKQALLEKCIGKSEVLVRIACRELESWYLGDLSAVEKGLQISGIAQQQQNKKYRSPDKLVNAAEELEKLTKKSYQKVAGSREIGKYLSLQSETNYSHSFKVFLSGLRKFLQLNQE